MNAPELSGYLPFRPAVTELSMGLSLENSTNIHKATSHILIPNDPTQLTFENYLAFKLNATFQHEKPHSTRKHTKRQHNAITGVGMPSSRPSLLIPRSGRRRSSTFICSARWRWHHMPAISLFNKCLPSSSVKITLNYGNRVSEYWKNVKFVS